MQCHVPRGEFHGRTQILLRLNSSTKDVTRGIASHAHSQAGEHNVKKTCWTILFVALCFTIGGLVSQVGSQNQAAAPPQFVAVVDVAELIKAHPDFKAKTTALQTRMKAEEEGLRTQQKAIADKELALQNAGLTVGTPEHTKQLEAIQNEAIEFEKVFKSKQRAFALENSQILFDTYQDIKREIGAFAGARRIAQVTDIRMFVPTPGEPQAVMEDMEQKLVWFDVQLDITENIVHNIYQRRNLTTSPDFTKVKTELRTAKKVQEELLKNAQTQAAVAPPAPTR